MRKQWWLLTAAGLMEIVWVAGLKHSTEWWHWLITAASIAYSFKVLLDAAAVLPLGTVYVVFTGIGTGGTAVAEIVVFGEPVLPLKLLFIALLAVGVLGLKAATGGSGTGAGSGDGSGSATGREGVLPGADLAGEEGRAT